MITINDLVGFILLYRKNSKAFQNYSIPEIQSALFSSFKNGTMCVTFSEGKADAEHITSICHWIEYPDRKTIYILNLLSNGSPNILPALLELMKKQYGPEWYLEGMRFGKKKNFGIQQKFAMRIRHSIKPSNQKGEQ